MNIGQGILERTLATIDDKYVTYDGQNKDDRSRTNISCRKKSCPSLTFLRWKAEPSKSSSLPHLSPLSVIEHKHKIYKHDYSLIWVNWELLLLEKQNFSDHPRVHFCGYHKNLTLWTRHVYPDNPAVSTKRVGKNFTRRRHNYTGDWLECDGWRTCFNSKCDLMKHMKMAHNIT